MMISIAGEQKHLTKFTPIHWLKKNNNNKKRSVFEEYREFLFWIRHLWKTNS